MATLVEIAEAIADAAGSVSVDNLQTVPFLIWAPSPPSLDVYPADPAQDDLSFGPESRRSSWLVRARVSPMDGEAAQKALLDLMEPVGATSVRQAIIEGIDVPDFVDSVQVEGPTGIREYERPDKSILIGCEWTVRILNSDTDAVSS